MSLLVELGDISGVLILFLREIRQIVDQIFAVDYRPEVREGAEKFGVLCELFEEEVPTVELGLVDTLGSIRVGSEGAMLEGKVEATGANHLPHFILTTNYYL